MDIEDVKKGIMEALTDYSSVSHHNQTDVTIKFNVTNNLYKNRNVKYDHINTIKNMGSTYTETEKLKSKARKNSKKNSNKNKKRESCIKKKENIKTSIDIEENTFNFVKRILYKDNAYIKTSDGNFVEINFTFNCSNKATDLYLVGIDDVSKNCETFKSIIEDINKINKKNQKLYLYVEKIDYSKKDPVLLKTNTKEKSTFYCFVTIINSKVSHISEFFSLISFKQFSKRENSFLAKHFKYFDDDEKNSDLKYYLNILFEKPVKRSKKIKFNSEFIFPISFQNVSNDDSSRRNANYAPKDIIEEEKITNNINENTQDITSNQIMDYTQHTNTPSIQYNQNINNDNPFIPVYCENVNSIPSSPQTIFNITEVLPQTQLDDNPLTPPTEVLSQTQFYNNASTPLTKLLNNYYSNCDSNPLIPHMESLNNYNIDNIPLTPPIEQINNYNNDSNPFTSLTELINNNIESLSLTQTTEPLISHMESFNNNNIYFMPLTPPIEQINNNNNDSIPFTSLTELINNNNIENIQLTPTTEPLNFSDIDSSLSSVQNSIPSGIPSNLKFHDSNYYLLNSIFHN